MMAGELCWSMTTALGSSQTMPAIKVKGFQTRLHMEPAPAVVGFGAPGNSLQITLSKRVIDESSKEVALKTP